MRQFELRCSYSGRNIIAQVLQLPQGVHISLYGGDLPHIGAVGIVDQEGHCNVTQFSGHKEGVICKKWTSALSDAGFRPAVVEAGIHYDRLDKNSIEAVIDITNKLLNEVLARMTKDKQ